MYKFTSIFRSLRPVQWIKNIFVFAGLVFSQNFTDASHVLRSISAFFVFCALAGGIYIFNDIIDLSADKLHPVKRFRPLPSGELPLALAWFSSLFFILAGLAWAFWLSTSFFIVCTIYVVMQFFYTIALKKLVIVDIIVVAAGFLLRAVAGAVVLDVIVSSWLLLCTSFLALFLVTGKRAKELTRTDAKNSQRSVLAQYSDDFLNELLTIEAAGAIISYSLYVFSPETFAKFGNNYLQLSLPFVIYGVLRYLYILRFDTKGESPEKLLVSDKSMIINFALWCVAVVAAIYA